MRKNFKPKKDSKDQSIDKVVYKTKLTGPRLYEDWQLKLKAISMCMSNNNGEIINSEVENIYQGLIHRTK